MGKKIRITESQLKKIVGGLVTEQSPTSTINTAGGTSNPNVSPLRGKTVKLYKDMDNQVQENMAMILKIRNVIQEKGKIKISFLNKITERNIYLENESRNDRFK
jgi:DNA-dependent RNA polymerase auxiliary subunit epsilon